MKRFALYKAFAALWWERLAPVLWPVAILLAVYAGLALFGLWDAVGDPWRALAALAGLGLAGWFVWRAWKQFAAPTHEEAARRVEEDSGITARPHEALLDQPADRDDVSVALWQAHRDRMSARLSGANARRPKAAWAAIDAWGLRVALVLFVVVGVGVAGEFAAGRLGDAFGLRPIYRSSGALTVDAWLDPPAYTGRAPVIIREEMARIEAPEGSTLIVRTAGVGREPSLRLDGERGENRRIGDGVWESRIPLMTDAVPELRAGGRRQSWRIHIISDTEPVVRMTDAPEARATGELVLHFRADDDYGAVSYSVEFRRRGDDSAEWESLEIQPASAAETDEGFRAIVDTGQHRLAGSRVDLRVTATDAADNTGRSPSIAFTLPERIFLDSLARAVAEQRREVMSARSEDYADLPELPVILSGDVPTGTVYMGEEPERRIERAPEGLQHAANAIDAMTDAPEYFFEDPIVYLGLRRALLEIRRARGHDEIGPVEENLWQIALRAELGSLSDAEAALRAAERALMEALARGADESELAPLFEAYQQAMENYLAALAREAAESGEMAEGGGEGGMDTQGLMELLNALREAAELGDTADARRALQTLGELLRNLQMQMAQGGSGEGDDALTQAMREALEELGDVIGEQRELQDQTFGMTEEGQGMPGQPEGAPQQGQGSGAQGPQDQQGGGQAQALAQQQGRLAEELAAIAQGFPGAETGEALSGAQEAMRQAQEALEQGDAQAALEAQNEALQALREGAEGIAQDMLDRMAENEGGAEGEEGENDPLGRPGSGSFSSGTGVDIPDEDTRQRARRILEQLRERAAEQGRPQDEIDYIERLLERFGS